MSKNDEYVVVTAISSYRMRYVIPKSELNKDDPTLSNDVLKSYAMDSVVMEEVKEFSQRHIGEDIVDVTIEDTDTLIARFDDENDYLSGWDKEQKLSWIDSWVEPLSLT